MVWAWPQLRDRHISGLILQVAPTEPVQLLSWGNHRWGKKLSVSVGSSFVSSASWNLPADAAGISSAYMQSRGHWSLPCTLWSLCRNSGCLGSTTSVCPIKTTPKILSMLFIFFFQKHHPFSWTQVASLWIAQMTTSVADFPNARHSKPLAFCQAHLSSKSNHR